MCTDGVNVVLTSQLPCRRRLQQSTDSLHLVSIDSMSKEEVFNLLSNLTSQHFNSQNSLYRE